jgi:hypothetical protein
LVSDVPAHPSNNLTFDTSSHTADT